MLFRWGFGAVGRVRSALALVACSWQCDDSSLLRITSVSRSFPGVQALDNAGLEVLRDEIHALFGENGAGKSTLINILSGAQQPDSGAIEFAGEKMTMASPHDAQRRGVVTIYQEFTPAPSCTAFVVYFSWLSALMRPKLELHFRRLSESQRSGSRFR